MADETTADFTAPVGELPASPAGPTDGEPAPNADSEFIMSTLFGQDEPAKAKAPEPAPQTPAGDQAPGAKPAGGVEPGTAPPTPAPAAKGSETAPPESPPVPGVSASQPEPKTEQPASAPPKTPAPGTQPAAAEPAPAETRLTAEERLQLAGAAGLAEQNRQLLEALRNTTTPQGQPQSPGAPAPGAQPSGIPVEQVHLTVPDNLYNAMFDEDERVSKNGLNVLVSSIATAALNLTLQKVVPLVDQRIAGYDQQNRQTTTAASQEEDYYNAFPAHRNPLFRTAIEAEMQKMAQELPNAPWNVDFRNALGTRVNRTLQLLGINVGMVPGEQPAGNPPAAGFGAPAQPNGGTPPPPAPMLDNSSRDAAPANAGDFIAATFTS